MDAWLRDTPGRPFRVMQATTRRRAGPGEAATAAVRSTCTRGRPTEAARLTRHVIASMPGTTLVVVDSAGCGAVMKDYGRLLGTPEAAAFATQVHDFSEWVVEQGAPPTASTGATVVIQDAVSPAACAAARRARVRATLAPCYSLAETDDDGLCCGGRRLTVLQPGAAPIDDTRSQGRHAGRARARPVVASANPGCMLHLRGAGLDVRHPADLLAAALEEQPDGRR